MTTYVTGSYHLHLFDRRLVKVDTRNHTSLLAAQDEGEELIKKPPYASYVVTRVITNSVDRLLPWESSLTEEEIDETVRRAGGDAGSGPDRDPREPVLPEN